MEQAKSALGYNPYTLTGGGLKKKILYRDKAAAAEKAIGYSKKHQ